ncbi:MAG: pantoate--beta-alanine ligase [Gammaproteobacteria bacterium]|nr:pantoate--beta-alanine ligase [Gammaproteobacteria bacterium]
MQIFNTIGTLQECLKCFRDAGKTIALVPTMGGLHEAHLQLVEKAKTCADIVITSIFVNPTQFAPHEDFDEYPRNPERDQQLLEQRGVDILFLPNIVEIYPANQSSDYDVGPIGALLCGVSRPIFFNGVAQVVSRFFDIVEPDVAVFGEKDFQQLQIIKQLVERQQRKVSIIPLGIVREDDGLAMSTRNKYLNVDERALAPSFNQALRQAKTDYLSGIELKEVISRAKTSLGESFELDYFEILDANTLTQITTSSVDVIIVSAVKLGATRLIDNIVFRRSNV